jgi:hypothetical protein
MQEPTKTMAKGETQQVRVVGFFLVIALFSYFFAFSSHIFLCELLPGQESEALEVHGKDFRAMYYMIASIQVLSIPVFLLAGQTTCIFTYDWTVRNGLQESGAEVGPSMVQVNCARGVTDTISISLSWLPLPIDCSGKSGGP